jgi:hypothetical protein
MITALNTAMSALVELPPQVPPTITTQPSNQSVTVGQNVAFTVVAGGNPTPTFQWQVNTGTGWSNIPDATNAILTLYNVALAQNGNQYRAIVMNMAGEATSIAATLTVTGDGTDLRFAVPNTQSMAGRDILIPINVTNNNNSLNAVTVTVNFDSARLEWQPLGIYSSSNAATHPWTIGVMPFAFGAAPSTLGTNSVTFMFMEMGGVDTANGTLITLRLRVRDSAPLGDANISISFTSVGDAGGAITPPAQFNTSGRITVTNIIPGDLNGDGVIDIFDALYLARALNGWPGYTLCPVAADTNGDGTVDIFDALYLARHLNGWPGYEILGSR